MGNNQVLSNNLSNIFFGTTSLFLTRQLPLWLLLPFLYISLVGDRSPVLLYWCERASLFLLCLKGIGGKDARSRVYLDSND